MLARIAVWAAVVTSMIILLAFAGSRFANMGGNPPRADGFGIRYVQHPRLAVLHIVPGLLFLTLGALQFVAAIRHRHIRVHRRLGWVLVACAAVSGVSALVVNVRFPAYGGISTQAATIFFAVIFLFALTKATRHIRRKQVRLHREWMLRAFALAMGVASVRVFVVLFLALSRYRFEEVFGASFWLGFSVNLLAAEIWINRTRPYITAAPPHKV
jgi:uncharacterized membrane protein